MDAIIKLHTGNDLRTHLWPLAIRCDIPYPAAGIVDQVEWTAAKQNFPEVDDCHKITTKTDIFDNMSGQNDSAAPGHIREQVA